MTVAELREALDAFDSDLQVIVDCNSEYIEVDQLRMMKGIDNGGYISHLYPFSKQPTHKIKDYLLLE